MTTKNHRSFVTPTTLRELVDAGAVSSAFIRFDQELQGLIGIVKVGDSERLLGIARGVEPRHFSSIDGIVSALQDCGIYIFTVDATGFVSRGKKTSQSGRVIQNTLEI